MRTRSFAIATIVGLALATVGACFGGIDSPGLGGTGSSSGSGDPGPLTPQDEFATQVAPLMLKCLTCHVGPETTATNMFLGADQSTMSYYDGITNDRAINGNFDPAAATILSKGNHEGSAWTGTEAQTISSWLDAEATARDGGSDDTISAQLDQSPRGAEEQWAGCLAGSGAAATYTETKAYAIVDMVTDTGVACWTCHEPGGAGGAYLGKADAYLDTLAKWQQEVFLVGVFEPEVQAGATPTYKIGVAQTKICAKGEEMANGSGSHPAYDCMQNVDGVAPLNALGSFVTVVEGQLNSGACPKAAFAQPSAGSGP